MRHRVFLLALATTFCGTFTFAEVERSIVKITNYSQPADWIEPWRPKRVSRGSGSGFVIEGNRIMTNAHVVSWSKKVTVYRYQDPKPYAAEVEFFGHDCDLAILKVKDESFFEGIRPLQIGSLPQVRSSVTTYGYPALGQQISYTKGVVSRIETQNYKQSNRRLLTGQTDAAINPGNSGGPVIQDDLVVGVAFQGVLGLQNMGFFIPPEMIRHFLKDIEDGHCHGFPTAGIRTVKFTNPTFRESLGLPPDGNNGVRIDMIAWPFPKTRELLRENDVLLEVSGYEVGSDGTVLYKGNRVECRLFLQNVQNGESVNLKIWRDGTAFDIALPVFIYPEGRISQPQYAVPPYVIVGGLVFTELSVNYMQAAFPFNQKNWQDWTQKASPEAIYALWRSHQSEENAETNPVVLSKTLKHPVNLDFGVGRHSILSEVNGRPIRSIQDLKSALERKTDAFHRFRFLSGKEEALNRNEARIADAELLKQYKIPSAEKLVSGPVGSFQKNDDFFAKIDIEGNNGSDIEAIRQILQSTPNLPSQ